MRQRLAITGLRLVLLAGLMTAVVRPAAAAEFPYEKELLMDVNPMRGSKRVPSLEVDASGLATLDLWCNSMKARVTVTDGNVTFELGDKVQAQNQCTPERSSADEAILATLTQVTAWHRQNGLLVLEGGGQSLRFRASTN
jgi:heat shock protein HslJ